LKVQSNKQFIKTCYKNADKYINPFSKNGTVFVLTWIIPYRSVGVKGLKPINNNTISKFPEQIGQCKFHPAGLNIFIHMYKTSHLSLVLDYQHKFFSDL